MSLRTSHELGAIELSNVQETLLTPLCARADQWGRADAIIIDQTAKQLVDAIDYDFDKIRRFPNTLTGCAVRAAIMDGWITDFLQVHPTGSIGLLGVGLDTVFERSEQHKQATWFEFDFADVIALRERCFAPDPRRHAIAGDILDLTWIKRVRAMAPGPWLFQAAGVLMYLQPAQVRLQVESLANHFPGATFLFDGCSQFAKQNSQRWEATIRTTAANYYWAIDNPRKIADWDPRVRVTDVRYLMDYHRRQWRWDTRIWLHILPKLRKAYHVNRAQFSNVSANMEEQ